MDWNFARFSAFLNQKICRQETPSRKRPGKNRPLRFIKLLDRNFCALVAVGNDTSALFTSDKCFSYAENRLLVGMAGALEHQVTLQECKCLCAQMGSKSPLVCKSFMYYTAEQDCVLNREDRNSRPELFKKESATLGVTYFQLHCQQGADTHYYFIISMFTQLCWYHRTRTAGIRNRLGLP